MDIDRVRYFNVFSELGSLVKASEILNISQPALSKALRLLESEVGVKLIEPEGRGLRLTTAGKRFRDETAPLLAQWSAIPQRVQDHESWKPTKIASFEVFTTYFLGHLVDFLALDGLEVHEFGPGKMEQAVADGRADIAITYLPVPNSGIEFIEIGKIRMSVYGRKDQFSKQRNFSNLPFAIPIFPSEGTPSKVAGIDGWPDHKFERNAVYRVTMMESALELCRKGKCVAYLPDFVVRLHNEKLKEEYRLTEVDSPIAAKERLQSVFLIHRRGSQETSLHRKIAKSLRALT